MSAPRRHPNGAARVLREQMLLWVLDAPPKSRNYWTVTLTYDPADPLLVRLAFAGYDDQPWEIGRDLLAAALVEHVGYGDVRIWPAESPRGSCLHMVLAGDSGAVLYELPRPDVRRFLDRTYRQVRRGAEVDHLDLDRLVARLLAETP